MPAVFQSSAYRTPMLLPDSISHNNKEAGSEGTRVSLMAPNAVLKNKLSTVF